MQPILVLPWVLLTVLCWGNYGPLMHEGQHAMQGSLRPFICVGFAYFVIGVVIPWLLLRWQRESGSWSISGVLWSLLAGAVGALGALGVIMAFRFQGKPVYVMPLVFGGAPVVNTLVTMLMSRTLREARPVFYLGVLLVALGAAGVLYFQPRRPPDASHPQAGQVAVRTAIRIAPGVRFASAGARDSFVLTQTRMSFVIATQEAAISEEPAQPAAGTPPTTAAPAGKPNNAQNADKDNTDDQADSSNTADSGNAADSGNIADRGNTADRGDQADRLDQADTADRGAKSDKVAQTAASAASKPWNGLAVMASVLTAALCWGAYGPVLHRGQMRMGGSRLRPFLCVGIAYFLIAVLAPIFLLRLFQEPGQWNAAGVLWSLAGGAAGAIGALGIILAFNWGGRPIFVMPLVFGCAPVVNTFTTVVRDQSYDYVTWPFFVSLILVIAGAVTVLVFAPRPQHGPAHATR